MIFNFTFGLHKSNTENVKVIRREAVRGIVISNDKILMVHSNKGDYKLPGGGINTRESHEEALMREIREETGYIMDKALNKIGIVTQRNIDKYERDSIFEMTSYYYLCKVTDKQVSQQLDDYEKELDFSPIWIKIDSAISHNEEVMRGGKVVNSWVYRENMVLKALRDWYGKRRDLESFRE